MRLQQYVSSRNKITGKEYSKWILTIPNSVIKKMGWKAGLELGFGSDYNRALTLEDPLDHSKNIPLLCKCDCHTDLMSFCFVCVCLHSNIKLERGDLINNLQRLVDDGFVIPPLKDGKIIVEGKTIREYDLADNSVKTSFTPITTSKSKRKI